MKPPPPGPVVVPSSNFKIEPRISCSKGCHVVSVKIVFDSAGNVIAESVLEEEKGARVSSAQISKGKACKGKACKPKPLIKKLSQPVVAGPNTLQLKLTGAALKTLAKKGKLNLKVNIAFTPTGGTTKAATHTFKVKLPKKGKADSKKGGKQG